MSFPGSLALAARSKIRIGMLSVFGTLLAIPTLLWAGIWIVCFIDRFGEKCNFGSINDVEYESISSRARAQPWTVWPDLSNGVFFASRGDNIGRQLTLHIGELAGSDPSSNRQLASAHAVMRSIGAEYVQTQELPDTGRTKPVRVFISHTTCRRFGSRQLASFVWCGGTRPSKSFSLTNLPPTDTSFRQ